MEISAYVDGITGFLLKAGVTQAELADRIGTRQQTISEWETGASTPRRMSQRLLRMVAEEAGVYDASSPAGDASPAGEDKVPPPGETPGDGR